MGQVAGLSQSTSQNIAAYFYEWQYCLRIAEVFVFQNINVTVDIFEVWVQPDQYRLVLDGHLRIEMVR